MADPKACRCREFEAALWNRRKAKRAQRARFYCINGGEGDRIEKSLENLKNYQSGSESKYLRHSYTFPKSYLDTKGSFW